MMGRTWLRVLLLTAVIVASLAWAAPRSALAASETLSVPFVLGVNGVQTEHAFSGPIRIDVSGSGQAAGSQLSDAFYIFADENGQPLPTPYHVYAFYTFGLFINGGPADAYVAAIPAYNPSHAYTISVFAPGGRLTFGFGVGDAVTADNSGAFTVTITNRGGPELRPTH